MISSFSSEKKPVVSAELEEEVAGRFLGSSGTIPKWLSGTLVRNGPIKVTIDGQSNAHLFDGLAMLHAFSFCDGRVNYTNQFLRSGAYHTVFDKGSLNYGGFAADPCRSLFKRFFTFFFPRSHSAIHNANINVAKYAEAYVALTETPLPVQFDLQTLNTLGVFDFQDQLPKDRCWESAHPHHDLERGETLNYLVKFGMNSCYTLYAIKEGSAERKIIAEVPVKEPSYMHSFAMTQNYIILTEFPLVVKPLDLITKGEAFIKNFSWKPERGTRFIVINREDGSILGTYHARPFFAFHHANAFEKEGVIHMDVVTYADARIITELYVHSEGNSEDIALSRLERFSLSLKTGEITSEVLLAQSNEFPRVNEALDGRPHCYLYTVGFAEGAELLQSECLYKINTLTKEVMQWSEKGYSPGEPVFVAAPDAQEEDEGVILTVVIDHVHHDSFLLILDGKSFKEVGRARAPHCIPVGFHGQYFS
jgi:beta,beta-carotene 9',10'-dioxygenase